MSKFNKTLAVIATLLIMCNTTQANEGWGHKQSQDTVKGLLLGGLLGGVVGHQHDKQKEGIIIGSILGSVIGNKTGSGRDARHAEQQAEANRIRLQQQREARYRDKLAAEQQAKTINIITPANTSSTHVVVDHVDADVIAATKRVEMLERQVQLEQQRVQAAQHREIMLQQMQQREQAALKQLQQLRSIK